MRLLRWNTTPAWRVGSGFPRGLGFPLPDSLGTGHNRRMQWLYLDANQQQVSAEEEQLGELIQSGAIQAETMLWNETMSDWQAAQALWPDTFAAAAPAVTPPVRAAGPPMMKRRGSKPVGRPTRPGARPKKKAAAGKTASATRKGAARGTEDDDETNAATRRFAGIFFNHNGWVIGVSVMTIILGALVVFGGVAALVDEPNLLAVIPIVLGAIPVGVATLLLKASGSIKLAVETGFPENLDKALAHLGNYFLGIGIFLVILLTLIIATIAAAIFAPSLFIPGAG